MSRDAALRTRRRSRCHRNKLWFRVYRGRIDAGHERCRNCRASHRSDAPLTFDHLIAWALGGPLRFDNATILCHPCNRRKGTARWPHLRSLAAEEADAPPERRWYVLAVIANLRAVPTAYSRAGIDGCAITLSRRRRAATTCLDCPLDPRRQNVRLGSDPALVLDHVHAHRAAGQHVPTWVDDLIGAYAERQAHRTRARYPDRAGEEVA